MKHDLYLRPSCEWRAAFIYAVTMLQRKGQCFFPIDSLECEKLGNFKNPKYTYIYIYCIYINILIIQRVKNSSWFLFTRLSTRKIYCPVKIKLPWQLMMRASDSSKLQSWQWSYKGIRGTVSREKYVHYFSRTARRDACQILVRTAVPRDIGMNRWRIVYGFKGTVSH